MPADNTPLISCGIMKSDPDDDDHDLVLVSKKMEGYMASYRQEHERGGRDGIPSLEEMEVGRPVGAILPMSEHAQVALRESIELIDYLMNQEDVTWN
jgi:hypothetical protein